jgi:hypothetical protein
MTDRDVRTLVDAVITARRWTTNECVRHFADTAADLGEPATLSAAQLKRWRRGRLSGLPRPTACRVAERLFGYPIEELLASIPPDYLPPRHGVVPATPPLVSTDHYFFDVEPDPIMSAAHDASEHAADAGRAIEDTTLEQLHVEVTRLAHTYAATPPVVMFAQLRRARNLTYRMLERTRRPAQISDLYLIAGQLSGLMAAASYDLGHPDAAAEQARAAFTYGQIIDHNTLRAWARATLSMIALWSGRPREGVTHAQAGLEHVTAGDTAVRLHALAGRCWALAGSQTRAMDAVHAADDARQSDDGADEFADGIGGEFVFGPARHALCLGATYLALDQPVQAAAHTQAALALYESGPVEQRAIGGIHGARVDLAMAHAIGADLDTVRDADLDAVLDAVGPTLALEAEHRTNRLNARLHQLRSHLAGFRFRGSLQADRLADEIEEFMAAASGPSPRALP